MDALRKQLGELVRTAREAQGHRSQPSFADAAGISARIISDVERGQKVGRKSLEAIERTLRWPTGSAAAFLAGGVEPAAGPLRPAATTNPPHEWSAHSRAKILAMPVDDIVEMGRQIRTTSGTRAQILWLSEALRLKAEAEQVQTNEDVR